MLLVRSQCLAQKALFHTFHKSLLTVMKRAAPAASSPLKTHPNLHFQDDIICSAAPERNTVLLATPPCHPSTSSEAVQASVKRRRIHPCAARHVQSSACQPDNAVGSKPANQTAGGGAKSSDSDQDGLWMIVGLGNPGRTYDRTRHNVGFAAIDHIAQSAGIECSRFERHSLIGKGEIAGKKVLLVKPITYMNHSGSAVAALSKYYKVPASRLVVITDDLDSPNAVIKLKQKGGAGGHNGLKSIIEHLSNTQDFPRIKIGIGRPEGGDSIITYVLQRFSPPQQEQIDAAVKEAGVIVRSILSLGLVKALSGKRVQ